MNTLNARMHVSFSGLYTAAFNIDLEKAFKLIRTSGRRGAIKGLSRTQAYIAAINFIYRIELKDVLKAFQKDFLKMYLKVKTGHNIQYRKMTKEELSQL